MSGDFGTELLAGGTVRSSVRSATAEEAMSAPVETNRVHTGVVRADGSGQLAQYTHEAPAYSGSVMATAVNNIGGQRIDSTTTVELPGGMRTSLKVAEELGYVARNAAGQYIDAIQATPQVPQHGHQEATDSGPANEDGQFMDRASEAEFEKAAAGLPAFAVEPALAGAVNAVVDDSPAGWESVASNLARDANIDPDQAAELVEHAYEVFEARTARLAASMGLEGDAKEAAYDWARTARPRELQAAVGELMHQGSLQGFRQLLVEHKVQTGKAQLAQWRSMGFDGHVDRETGDVMVSRDGGRPVRARDLGGA